MQHKSDVGVWETTHTTPKDRRSRTTSDISHIAQSHHAIAPCQLVHRRFQTRWEGRLTVEGNFILAERVVAVVHDGHKGQITGVLSLEFEQLRYLLRPLKPFNGRSCHLSFAKINASRSTARKLAIPFRPFVRGVHDQVATMLVVESCHGG